jgi:hypothetical protein
MRYVRAIGMEMRPSLPVTLRLWCLLISVSPRKLVSLSLRRHAKETTMAAHIKSAHATPVEGAATWGMTQHSLDEVAKACAIWLDGANKVSNEAFRFAHDRLNKDIEAAAQFMRCSDPGEAFKLQAEFASELAGDYLTESQKMLDWVSQLATEDQLRTGRSSGGKQHVR